MIKMKLNIQRFSDGKVVIDTELNTKNFENGLDKIKNTSSKAGSTIKNIVAGLGITKLISTAMGQINSSIDGAIARLDTLNNFPKVMSNLGIASEDAEESISKMSDKLAGLPTTLDQGASAVQRFTSANGDVKKSTDIFLALNNAILAGGASSEIQASALEQLSQAYAKGKPDMMEWRTAMTAMPAQLKQVATAMGYVSADELGEALREGTVSMDDFMNTITKLNTEGVDGFASFEEQAKNSTGGIGTSITVAKTQIVKGVTDMIDGLNKGLADANLPSISEIISTIGKKAKEALDKIAGVLPDVIKFIVKISPILEPIAAAILAIVGALTIYNTVVSIATAVQAGLNLVMSMNPIGLLVLAIVGLVAAFAVLWKKCEGFRNFFIGMWNGIKSIFTSVIDFIKNNWKSLLLMIVNPFAGAFKLLYDNCEGFRNFINGFVEKIKSLFEKLKNGVINAIKGIVNIINTMKDIGTNIVKGIWQGISGSLSWIKDKISGWVGNVLKFIKKLFGIHSPSTVMRDEVGKYLAQGLGVGFDDELDNVYKDMQKSINFENAKIQASVESGKVFNSLVNSTPISISLDGSVEMDSQRVGRIITPVVSKTIKTGGGY